MISGQLAPVIRRAVWCGGRAHLVRAWMDPAGWQFELDPPSCGEAEAVLAALSGGHAALSCADLVGAAEWLVGEGFDPHEAISWASSGLVDPDRRRRRHGGPGAPPRRVYPTAADRPGTGTRVHR
jgi:hypothetical protein